MKIKIVNLFIIVLIFLFAISCNKKDKDEINVSVIENKASIKFDTDVLDFHTIAVGEKVTGSFKFKNTGNNDLIISSVNANCGCTVADYPREAIKPGGEGMISVTYDSKGSQGMRIQKNITVLANTNPVKTVLTIVADVK